LSSNSGGHPEDFADKVDALRESVDNYWQSPNTSYALTEHILTLAATRGGERLLGLHCPHTHELVYAIVFNWIVSVDEAACEAWGSSYLRDNDDDDAPHWTAEVRRTHTDAKDWELIREKVAS
jgi:hypothetical protein